MLNNATLKKEQNIFQTFVEDVKFALYLITHPIDGYYQMKHEKRGKTYVIFLNIFLFWVCYSINKQYVGFVIQAINPLFLNSIIDFISICLLFLLWSVANWSVTTLTDGEGKLRDVAMATSYAFTPMIVVFIPATILGNYVAANEQAFYGMLIGISIVWFLILLFVGIMTVHNYTLGKTVLTAILTSISILIIIFLVLLMTTLVQQVYMFLHSIYTELIFRA